MYGESFPKTIAVAILGTAFMFAAAALFEFVYEIKVEPKQKEEPAVEQVVSVPVDYIFCIDDSTSMNGNDPQKLRDSALMDLLGQIDPSSRVGILRYVTFYKSGDSVGLAPLDENQKELLRNVLMNHDSGGGTNFDAPLQEALDEYIKADETGRKPIVVLLTDGEDDSLDVQHWVDEYNKNGITLCGIFLGKDSSNYLETMKTLCEGTKGVVVKAEDASLSCWAHMERLWKKPRLRNRLKSLSTSASLPARERGQTRRMSFLLLKDSCSSDSSVCCWAERFA